VTQLFVIFFVDLFEVLLQRLRLMAAELLGALPIPYSPDLDGTAYPGCRANTEPQVGVLRAVNSPIPQSFCRDGLLRLTTFPAVGRLRDC
jgi:hypothetical protein